MVQELTSVRSIPNPSFNGISNDRTTTNIRDINPKLVAQVVVNQVIMKIEECDTGLHESKRSFNVNFKNLVHVFPEVKADTSRYARCSAAVSCATLTSTIRTIKHSKTVTYFRPIENGQTGISN